MGNALAALKIDFHGHSKHYALWSFPDVLNAYKKYKLPPMSSTQEGEYNQLSQEMARLELEQQNSVGLAGEADATVVAAAAAQKLDQWITSVRKQTGSIGPELMIRKKDFMRLFCDYATPSTTGAVVVLPLEEFDQYLQEGRNTILVLEPFIMLTLLSASGTKKEKLEFLFNAFDLNASGSLHRDEIKTLMIVLRNTLHKTASAPFVEDVEGLTDVVLDLMDTNQDKQLSQEEFVKWASSEDKGVNLIGKFMGGEPQRLLEMDKRNVLRKKTKLDVGKSGKKKKGVMNKYNLDATQEKREKRIRSYYDKREKDGYGQTALRAYDRKQAFNEEYGRLNAVASREVLTNLIFETNFNFKDLSDLRLQFADAAGTTELNGRHTLNIETLKKVLIAHFPTLEDGQTLDRIAAVFDMDGSGAIDFEEFVSGVNQAVAGPPRQKVALGLRLLDRNGDGTVSEGEIVDMLKDVQEDNDQIIEYLLDHFDAMDTNADGNLDLAEFADFMLAKPVVLNFLWQFYPAPNAKAGVLMKRIAEMQPTNSEGGAKSMLENVILMAETMRKSDIENAKSFLSRLRDAKFSIPSPCPLDHPAVGLYEVVYGKVTSLEQRPDLSSGSLFRGISGTLHEDDADDSIPEGEGAALSGMTVFRDMRKYTPQQRLLNTLFKGAAVTNKEKAMAICLSVDAEGKTISNQIIEKEELIAYLQHGQADYDEMHHYAQRIISAVDTSKDGQVDIEEMTQAMLDDPLLLEFFGGLFNLDFSAAEENDMAPLTGGGTQKPPSYVSPTAGVDTDSKKTPRPPKAKPSPQQSVRGQGRSGR
jgi:Ca2+-binding EF-hand superfamily protein